MKFRNKTSEDLRTRDGLVEAGGELDVAASGELQAPGLVLQCGPDGPWEPADAEAEAAVTAALKAQDEALHADDEPTPKPKSKPRAATSKTKE